MGLLVEDKALQEVCCDSMKWTIPRRGMHDIPPPRLPTMSDLGIPKIRQGWAVIFLAICVCVCVCVCVVCLLTRAWLHYQPLMICNM